MKRTLYDFEVIVISCTNLRGMQMSNKWKRKRKFEWCFENETKNPGADQGIRAMEVKIQGV